MLKILQMDSSISNNTSSDRTNLSFGKFDKQLGRRGELYWLRRGENMVLKLFHEMAKRVPAYRKIIKENNIRVSKIRTIKDFDALPLLNKNNYLKRFSLMDLSWDGNFKNDFFIYASTSGTTGKPIYFPRNFEQIKQYALLVDIYLRDNFDIQKRKTLYINCFALGVWIGGLFTHEALSYLLAKRKYPLHVISPGINKEQIIKIVQDFGNSYDQIILGGYPPFIKDIIDCGEQAGINWKKLTVGIIFSAEPFSESFREYICDHAGIKNKYKGTLNHYGTVDLGTMSYETPFSVLVRKSAIKNKGLYNYIFENKKKLPTLTQYIPELFYFEEKSNHLLCSAHSGVPLLRYELHDRGGIISYSTLLDSKHGQKLHSEAVKSSVATWKLPFVYVYERDDQSVTLYGLNIYPEFVRSALLNKQVSNTVTGKFSMCTRYDENHNQYLEINVELQNNHSGNQQTSKKITIVIVQSLKHNISEFAKLYEEIPDRAIPKVILWKYGSNTLFRNSGKQKWVQ